MTQAWPSLPFHGWRDTRATLHMWLQIVGKIRLAQSPWLNHSWHVTLYVTPRGLSTLAIPHGTRTFQIDFDFIDHRLSIQASDGASRAIALQAQSVAAFYRAVMGALEDLELPVRIKRKPNEVPHPVRFDQDETHRSYDRDFANRFSRVLQQVERVLQQFRARFRGKSSPVQFFWGAADLAVSRFSGRGAPRHPGSRAHLPDEVLREAYSHECSSCGFWPGDDEHPEAAFFSYAYPEPPGFAEAKVLPAAARYSNQLKEFVLPYEEVRRAASPDAALLEFAQSTYEAAATLGRWDRNSLEIPEAPIGSPPHRV